MRCLLDDEPDDFGRYAKEMIVGRTHRPDPGRRHCHKRGLVLRHRRAGCRKVRGIISHRLGGEVAYLLTCATWGPPTPLLFIQDVSGFMAGRVGIRTHCAGAFSLAIALTAIVRRSC